MTTIGQQLQEARLSLDLSVEDVAFRTRIPASRVRDMENDDLSQFANLTYARGFLKLYSQFLGLDITEHLSQFSTVEFSHASGHEYVQTANATMNLPAAVFTNHGRARRPGLYVLVLLALTAGGVVWWNNRGEESSDTGERVESKEAASPAKEKEAAPPAKTDSLPLNEALANSAPPTVPDPAAPTPPPTAPDTAENATATPATPPAAPTKPPKAVVVEEAEAPPPPSKRQD